MILESTPGNSGNHREDEQPRALNKYSVLRRAQGIHFPSVDLVDGHLPAVPKNFRSSQGENSVATEHNLQFSSEKRIRSITAHRVGATPATQLPIDLSKNSLGRLTESWRQSEKQSIIDNFNYRRGEGYVPATRVPNFHERFQELQEIVRKYFFQSLPVFPGQQREEALIHFEPSSKVQPRALVTANETRVYTLASISNTHSNLIPSLDLDGKLNWLQIPKSAGSAFVEIYKDFNEYPASHDLLDNSSFFDLFSPAQEPPFDFEPIYSEAAHKEELLIFKKNEIDYFLGDNAYGSYILNSVLRQRLGELKMYLSKNTDSDLSEINLESLPIRDIDFQSLQNGVYSCSLHFDEQSRFPSVNVYLLLKVGFRDEEKSLLNSKNSHALDAQRRIREKLGRVVFNSEIANTRGLRARG